MKKYTVSIALAAILFLLATGYGIAYTTRGELVVGSFTGGFGSIPLGGPAYARFFPSAIEARVFAPAAKIESLIRRVEVETHKDPTAQFD